MTWDAMANLKGPRGYGVANPSISGDDLVMDELDGTQAVGQVTVGNVRGPQGIPGEQWSKGTLTVDSTLDAIEQGTFRVASGAVATALGLPARIGSLDVLEASGSNRVAVFRTNDTQASQPLQVWSAATNNAGVWQSWRRIYPDSEAMTGSPTPITAGTDINELMQPGRYRQLAMAQTGNADLHYPPGATHGYLDVINAAAGGTGLYTVQVWQEVFDETFWTATRRISGDDWTPWVRRDSGDSPDIGGVVDRVEALESASTRVDVQPGSALVYGDDRPAAWKYPAGTTIYWQRPSGLVLLDPSYRGDGYVGALGAVSGYSQLRVVKAAASGTVDVVCINPDTARHITYRIRVWDGVAAGTDDFQRVDGAWIGDWDGSTAHQDERILPRSNIEFAFQIRVDDVSEFVPFHNSPTAIAAAPASLTDVDGVPLDVASLSVGGAITDINGVRLRQSVYGRHPDTGEKNWVRVDSTTTISPDGMLQSEVTWVALDDVQLGSNYVPMTALNHAWFDQLDVEDGGTYSILTAPPAENTNLPIVEGKDMESGLFTSTLHPDRFVAFSYLDPDRTLLRTHPQSTETAWVQQRSAGLTKLYTGGFTSGEVIEAGTVWRSSAQWRYGETPDARDFV